MRASLAQLAKFREQGHFASCRNIAITCSAVSPGGQRLLSGEVPWTDIMNGDAASAGGAVAAGQVSLLSHSSTRLDTSPQ